MIKRISESIATEMVSAGVIEQDEWEVYQYSMEITIAMVLNIITSVILFAVFGRLLEGLIFFAAFLPLRTSSGGYHASTHFRCYLLSIVIILAFIASLKAVPDKSLYPASVFMGFISSVVIFALTPVGCINRQYDEQESITYRKISLIILAAEGFALLLLLTLNLHLQAFTVSFAMTVAASSLVIGEIDLLSAKREEQ
jgi:accessory gene regulator B